MPSVLDMDMIAELKDLLGGDMQTLIDTFVSDSASRLPGLQESLQQQNGDALRKAAHGFKGSCANVGAHLLADSLRLLEESADAGNWQSCAQLQQQIEQQYQQAVEALKQL